MTNKAVLGTKIMT